MSETMANIRCASRAMVRALPASVKLCNLVISSLDFAGNSMSKSIGITLLGCGTVGSGVVTILKNQAELLRRRTGLELEIRHIVVRDTRKPRALPPNIDVGSDLRAAIDAPDADIIVELMGGTGMAKAAIEHALSLGKPVVTANKSLLAAHGAELFALARK